jgi:hypothetical protein
MALVPLSPPFNTQALNADGLHSDLWEAHHQDVVDQLNIISSTMQRGVTDGSDAAAGQIGEYLTATASSIGLTSNVAANIVSLDLPAGDWDVSGTVAFGAGAGTHTLFAAGIDSLDTQTQATFPTGAVTQGISTSTRRYNGTSTVTVWLVGLASFSGTVTASGVIRARRVR